MHVLPFFYFCSQAVLPFFYFCSQAAVFITSRPPSTSPEV